MSVSSRGTASSASRRGDVLRESQELLPQIADVFFGNLELVLQDARSLVEDGVGHSQLNLAGPCEFEEFEGLPPRRNAEMRMFESAVTRFTDRYGVRALRRRRSGWRRHPS